ncbi:hypothetical protein JRO89_XS08G0161600 [Xanthoceras sorbifolium]|uniref:DUF4216 domain-containing protein n=1 Tax=Xanthoceras sorbifolium TaxID=99658 RepID=A0ABQ8HQ19_9ROSI|nr:hypothetical protein JRO89_XS08G0161600 [Xanthoceras sorbifolium]
MVHGENQNDVSYYGILKDIIELCYAEENKVVLFDCEWFDTAREGIASQAIQVYYLEGINDPTWSTSIEIKPRNLYEMPMDEGEPYQEEHMQCPNTNASLDDNHEDEINWSRNVEHNSQNMDVVMAKRECPEIEGSGGEKRKGRGKAKGVPNNHNLEMHIYQGRFSSHCKVKMTGIKPSLIECFKIFHLSKTKYGGKEWASKHAEALHAKLKAKKVSAQDQGFEIDESNIYREVVGKASHGRVLGMGSGIKANDIYGCCKGSCFRPSFERPVSRRGNLEISLELPRELLLFSLILSEASNFNGSCENGGFVSDFTCTVAQLVVADMMMWDFVLV